MRIITSVFSVLGAIACGLLIAAPAHAAETGTLKKIREAGEINLGYRESSIPFSYLYDQQRPVGYSIDLCLRVVDAIKRDLKLPNLQTKWTAVTSATRIPLIANGTIDIECGSTVNNLERQQQVGFSVTTFVVSTKFIAKKSSRLATLDDLRGKTVVCTSGTNTIARVNDLNAKRKLGMTINAGADHAESLLQVTSDRAVAFFEDDILLTGLAANSRNPAEWALGTEAYSIDPYALLLPRGDTEYKKVVDNALIQTFKSGDVMKIYEKWFQKPIPPKNITLNFPLSPALKKAIASPTDSPDPAAYQ
jgi:glutamate/aspartate transport system substrate-binding protein